MLRDALLDGAARTREAGRNMLAIRRKVNSGIRARLHARRTGEAGAWRARLARAAQNAHVGAPSRARDGTEK
jgi:hypothetical protein